jgi:hypothetical protein
MKHNEFSITKPLRVEIDFVEDTLWVKNRKTRKRIDIQNSLAVGLKNLDERFRLITGRSIEIDDQEELFSVTLPLVKIN